MSVGGTMTTSARMDDCARTTLSPGLPGRLEGDVIVGHCGVTVGAGYVGVTINGHGKTPRR